MWGLAPFCFLARSLARLGHGSAASSTDCQGHPQIQWITCRERCEGKVRLRRSRFSIGFAPLISITESDAQISGGETRQDYKDTRRFPLAAPSCALLFPSCGIRVVVEALPKSPRPVPFRQFAPSWAVCKNPPFSPTAAPYPVTIVLSPTR